MDEIHNQHMHHALSAIWRMIFVAVIAIGWQGLAEWWNPSLFIYLIGNGFCVLIFWIAFTGWWHGLGHLDTITQEYRIQIERNQTTQPKLVQPPIMFGRDMAKPEATTVLRIESKPPRDFLISLYSDMNRRGVVWGEERIAQRWGDASDKWLEELSKVGWIRGRDALTRKSGTLSGSANDVLDYFHYSTLPTTATTVSSPSP